MVKGFSMKTQLSLSFSAVNLDLSSRHDGNNKKKSDPLARAIAKERIKFVNDKNTVFSRDPRTARGKLVRALFHMDASIRID